MKFPVIPAQALPLKQNGVRSCIVTWPKKGQQCVVRQTARAILAMETTVETMMMIKILKSYDQV